MLIDHTFAFWLFTSCAFSMPHFILFQFNDNTFKSAAILCSNTTQLDCIKREIFESNSFSIKKTILFAEFLIVSHLCRSICHSVCVFLFYRFECSANVFFAAHQKSNGRISKHSFTHDNKRYFRNAQ